jgi:RNA polymerase sigma-70 factor (ECF subfamily)
LNQVRVEPSDEQLARRSIAGDSEAFGVLVLRLRAPLIGYVTGLLQTREDAEEVAQDAFLTAWQKIDGLRHPDRIAGWIFRIARNLATKRAARTRPLPLDAEPPCPSGDGRQRRLMGLLAAVARLSEPHREVIQRKHFSGRTSEEIARQLNVPPGTVRSRLSRAYRELRNILEEDDKEGERAGQRLSRP